MKMLHCTDALRPMTWRLRQEADMAYIVQAVLTESGMGTYRGELATWHAAIESARSLRRHGLKTTITDPDGKQVDETDDECGKKQRCG